VSRAGKRASALLNRSPVPQGPKGNRDGIFNVLTGKGSPTAEKQRRGMEQYGEVGTLFGIVSRLAESTAQVQWHLYRKQTDGRRVYREVETRKEVYKHAALDLLAKPNPLMDWMELCETAQQHEDLAGEFWWVVAWGSIRAAGPLELWPMRPDRVKIVTDDRGVLTGYIYVGPDGEQIPLLKDQVIQGRRPNPLDIYRGMGPVQALALKLDANRLAAEYNRNFFLNSAEPGGIIEVEDRLDDDEFRELVMRWREQHQGVANAHRVAILEQGKWVERKFSMKDMAFPELAELSREDIREAFGYPKGMTGATEDVNKAVADANERMFGRYLLRPRLERKKAVLNYQLLPLFGAAGEGLEFDFEDPVPEDREADSKDRITKAQALKLFVEAGADWKGALEVLGLPEIQQDEMKLQMAREAHEFAMNPPEPKVPGEGRESQGDGQTKPNQPPKKPSPAREANDS
jgi:HK97 family phage portal protein